MKGSKVVLSAAFGAALVLFVQGGAQAAPQILGLVATLSPTPLICDDGECKAEFSSFCLQKERAVPHARWRYEVPADSALWLVLTRADGSKSRVAAAPHVSVRAPRGFAAVEIAIPHSALFRLEAVAAALEVGPNVSIVPVARAGDDNPITPEEKLIATGPLRQAGSRIVDHDPEVLTTSRVLNGLINALPTTVRVGPGAREELWRQSLASGFVPAAGPENGIARRAYDTCWRNVAVSFGIETVRHCVQVRHDRVMTRKNRVYWKSIQAGS